MIGIFRMTVGESMIGQSIAAAADVMGAVNREIPNRFDLAHSLTKRKQNARFVWPGNLYNR